MLNQIRCPYCMETIDLSNEPIYLKTAEKISQKFTII